MDWLDLLAVQGTRKSLLQHHSSNINSSALSFLHRPTLTSIHDHWKNPDAGKDGRQDEKGMTEDEMVGWIHQLDGHEFEEALELVMGREA